MRTRSLLIVVLAVCLLARTTASADDTVSIATFNCYWLIESKIDKRDDVQATTDAQRAAAFQQKVNAVAQVIADIDADVIALEEVGDATDVEVLHQAVTACGVNYPHVKVCDSADSATKQHVAVFSKYELTDMVPRIPGRESYDPEPDDPEEEDDTGVSKGMRVTFSAHGRTFYFYALHLISEGGGYKNDAQRVAQASVVRRHYLPLLESGALVIVAGDLNDYRGQPALRRLRGRDDIYGDLIQTGRAEFFPDDKLDTRWTYMYMGQRNQIDHVLLSYSIKGTCKQNGIKARVIEHAGDAISDHRPLVVTLTLSND